MMTTSRPARLVAFGSLFLSIIFAVITILLGRWSDFFSVYAAGYFFAAAALIWLVLLIQFYQRSPIQQTSVLTQRVHQHQSLIVLGFVVAAEGLHVCDDGLGRIG